VTAVEILLSAELSDFRRLSRRVCALLGAASGDKFQVDAVLKARHDYVHEGVTPEGYSVPARAIALALSCLLRYAEVAATFPNRGGTTEYLDAVSHADLMAGSWGERGQQLLRGLVQHARESYDFPFLEDRLRKGEEPPAEG
jgi:hypothetical protein